MCRNVITIGRQCGSGGHTIGSELSKRLEIPLYDKEIIEMTAEKSGFDQEFIKETEEHREPGMLKNFVRNFSYAGKGKYEDYQSLEDQLYFAQRQVILEAAGKGPCVIVGRCADHILEKEANSLNVFIHADMEFKTAYYGAFQCIKGGSRTNQSEKGQAQIRPLFLLHRTKVGRCAELPFVFGQQCVRA